MTTHAPSLSHETSEIPQATVSETKLIAEVEHPSSAPAPVGAAALDTDWPTLSALSRRYIDRALHHTAGNKTRAADMLGIDRRTLNRILVRERARKAKPAKVAAAE